MQDYKENTIDQVDLNLKELFSILWKRKTLILKQIQITKFIVKHL